VAAWLKGLAALPNRLQAMPKQNNRWTSVSPWQQDKIIQIELIFRSIELLFPLLWTWEISGLFLTFCTKRLSIGLAFIISFFCDGICFVFFCRNPSSCDWKETAGLS
jgi:hypothetical protein